jgi:hypothetical protein
MSLMTLPTLEQNDTSSIHSRIEDAQFDVQINTPEGWTETKDFDQAILDTFELDGLAFRGLKFKNESQGCAVFFAADLDDDDEDDVEQAQELAFPGAKNSSFRISKVKINGDIEVEVVADSSKAYFKGAFEGNFSENSDRVFATGIISDDNVTYGTTALFLTDDYQLVIYSWGPDEAARQMDVQRFFKATTAIKKTKAKPAETVQVASDANPAVEAAPAIVEEVLTATPEAAIASDANLAVEAAPEAAPVSSEIVSTETAV